MSFEPDRVAVAGFDDKIAGRRGLRLSQRRTKALCSPVFVLAHGPLPNGFRNEGNNARPERRLTVHQDRDEFGRNPDLTLDEAALAQARAVAGLIVG